MAMHKTNSLLKYIVIPTIMIVFLLLVRSCTHHQINEDQQNEVIIKNTASNDNAAESLDTLTADLSKTKQKIIEISKDNETLKLESANLLNQMNGKKDQRIIKLSEEFEELKNQFQNFSQKTSSEYVTNNSSDIKPITIVDDLRQVQTDHPALNLNNNKPVLKKTPEIDESTIIPYYTIPANSTSVHDKLMTALVGRIPIKGIVTDPYPFKIVISDNNLAANGLRIPHLLRMIVSGYCEGDLNLVSVRGWITSLTFVFDDGTISSTTSNDNDIGNFTKSNSLGYLSDQYGNPFIRGKLITNAPTFLAGNVAMSAGVGAANAYAESQTTNSSSDGTITSAVTGSQNKFILGQSTSSAANEVQQWWHDRTEQSFDAIYVAPTDEKKNYVEIAVNFAKEIHIDYDPRGRKLNYAHNVNNDVSHNLD
jgi:hypothetical protein